MIKKFENRAKKTPATNVAMDVFEWMLAIDLDTSILRSARAPSFERYLLTMNAPLCRMKRGD